jgi:hypothetical protein
VEVVLDTNVLLANLRGARPSNDLTLVLADARARRFTLVVPHLVLEETVNKRREMAQDAERKLRKAQSDLASVGVSMDLPPIDLDRVVTDFRQQLLDVLAASKVEVRGLPSVGHGDIVRRALERRKPFAPSGAGYRDALIWETVLEATSATDEIVVLVTNNSKDFAENKEGTQLATDLVEDLEKIASAGEVRIVPDLGAFKDEFVAAETIAADELNERLNSDSPLRRRLFNGVARQLSSHVFDRRDISGRERDWDLDLPRDTIDADIESAIVSDVGDLHGVWVTSAQVSEDDVLIQLEAEVDAEIEIEVYVVTEGAPFDPDEPWHRERHHQTRYAHPSKTLLIGAEATYRPVDESLEDVHVFHVSV